MAAPLNCDTARVIMEAAKELHAAGQLVTREVLAAQTGFPLTTIDERIRHLVGTGAINRRQRGVYEPVERLPPTRPIHHCVLPGNVHKLEVGDIVLTLNPQEARTLGYMFSGAAFAYQTTELAHQSIERNNELSRRISDVSRKITCKTTDDV